MCINERHEVLVVQELRASTSTSQGNWKLPGGLVDLGEELDGEQLLLSGLSLPIPRPDGPLPPVSFLHFTRNTQHSHNFC